MYITYNTVYTITKIVCALWLAERRVYIVWTCKLGSDVRMFCFSCANHASTNFKKFLSWKLNKFTLFTYSLVGWNLENLYKICCVNFFSLKLTLTWREGKLLPGQHFGNKSIYGKAHLYLSPQRWSCSTQLVLQYYYMAYYMAESWVIPKDMENKINSFGTSCYQIILKIRQIDRVPNATIYSLTESAPLIERVRLRWLRFLGHVLRLPENEPVRDFVMYVPTPERKKPKR